MTETNGRPTRSARMQRKLAQTRADLLDAARALIAENGAAELRINDIVERADVSHGSFYSHFASKDEIVETILSETIGGLATSLAAAVDAFDDPAEQMSVSIRRVVRIAYEDPQLAAVLVNLNHAEQRFEAMILPQAEKVLTRGIGTGRFTIEDPDTTAVMFIGAVIAVIIAIVNGRLGENADIFCASNQLQNAGVAYSEAREIANRPLP